jgi:hypothetical protein
MESIMKASLFNRGLAAGKKPLSPQLSRPRSRAISALNSSH